MNSEKQHITTFRTIIAIILLLFIVNLCSCSNTNIKTGLLDFLSALIDKNITEYNKELTAYKDQLTQKDQLTTKKLALEKALSYCWRENQGNLNWSDPYDYCLKPISPNDIYHRETGYYITSEYDNFESQLNGVKEQLRYLESLTLLIQDNEKSIAMLNTIRHSINNPYAEWNVTQISTGIFVVSGYGLGWLDKNVISARWYYYEKEREFKPADIYSQELYNRLKRH